MTALLLLGLPSLVVVVLFLIRHWTYRKQVELDPKEFQLWFQRNYMGMNRPESHTGQPEQARKIETARTVV